MTAPAVNAFAAGSVNGGSNVSSDSIDFAAALGAPPSGALMIALWGMDGAGAVPTTSSTGWSMVGTGATAPAAGTAASSLAIFVGKEGVASTTLVLSHPLEQSAGVFMYVTGWSGTIADLLATFAGPTASTNADPPSATLSGKGDLLAIAIGTWGSGSNYASAGPSGYTYNSSTQRARTATTVASGSIAAAWLALGSGTTTEDPGVFTSTTDTWLTATLLIPAGTGGGSSLHGDAALTETFAAAATAHRIKHGDAALGVAFTVAASAHVVKHAAAALTFSAAPAATAHIGGTAAALPVVFSAAASATRTKHAAAPLAVVFTPAASAHRVKHGSANLPVNFAVTATAHVIKHAAANLNVVFLEAASADLVVQPFGYLGDIDGENMYVGDNPALSLYLGDVELHRWA